MCGVTGLLLGDPKATTAAVDLHESLFYLQHRGQDAAGISKVFSHFANASALIQNLPGWMGISHLRYPTAGSSSASEAQPFYVNSPFGLSLSVNGNLINPEYLREFLDTEARRHVNSDSDSELLLNVFAHALNELNKTRVNVDDIFTALREVYGKCIGGYACAAMVTGFGILGFRDANGIRPLCLGSRPSQTLEGAKDYFIASESIALRQLGFTDIVDILPGQAVFLQKGGIVHFRQIVERRSYTPDLFDRQHMGVKLAKKMKEALSEKVIKEIDVVIPVPETSNTAAATLAKYLDKPYSNAFVKNRYVYRTFILPGQDARKKGVRRKLSPIESEFKGKNVCIVDDSIYGIDLADPAELVAFGRTSQEIAEHIAADAVVYQDINDLQAACIQAAEGESKVHNFEGGVFSGKYITEVPDGYFEHLSKLRGKKKQDADEMLVASGGPVNVATGQQTASEGDAVGSGLTSPEYREDIK
ncbi:glutamine amidotransferase domain-containing protein [Hirsutella rhossiliensis]|uniref:Glutamine amidotransferase domain-containing protein n=1 Tax=Hirsutella rhossiliensis TaxID=111463 RepID=A0A9P8MSV6_9HYPO|nr:glutamine amidotransferase domain-containing protein [Hirsutella rhossiliensis]KAH0960549.1 glutamine amidotransferase domain-containing protein [Hirsutella rhossiliensis]